MFDKALAYAQLLRLSNGPTALADVWMGYAVVSGSLAPSWPLVLASFASLLLYHAGMVGNDLADVFTDREEGRDRPIANGQIFGWDAMRLQRYLEIAALLGVAAASVLVQLWLPMMVAWLLWTAIRWYNSPLKRTMAGPVLMGSCRALNGLLGMSLVGFEMGAIPIVLAVGLYVVGVTVYARDEALTPQRSQLAWGGLISLLGLAWLGSHSAVSESIHTKPIAIMSAWIAVALMATRGMAAAILQPTPRNIGRGVGIAIQGLVIIDATLAALYAGPMAGLAILALLPVTMLLARWIPQT